MELVREQIVFIILTPGKTLDFNANSIIMGQNLQAISKVGTRPDSRRDDAVKLLLLVRGVNVHTRIHPDLRRLGQQQVGNGCP